MKHTLTKRTSDAGVPTWLTLTLTLTLITVPERARAANVTLTGIDLGHAFEVSWTSSSLTVQPPYLHYEFQVQISSNLVQWENFGALIPGGVLATAAEARSVQLGKDAAARFARLSYRLNLPGGDLSGVDLSGADLRYANLANADLSGANLSGADLAGADLTGAILTGATLAGADLQDVDLDAFDWTGLDLSAIRGTPRLTVVRGNPGDDAATFLPALPFNPAAGNLVVGDPAVPGVAVSRLDAVVMLESGATVGQLNALVQQFGAAIVGSNPRDAFLENGLVVLRLPAATPLALYELTETLEQEAIVEAAVPDLAMVFDAIPDDSNGASGVGLCTTPNELPAEVWRWDTPPAARGGNWGWEQARVPQMWNLNDALRKNGAAPVVTCIYDGGFPAHPDLNFSAVLGPAAGDWPDHGLHTAGIVGATHGTNGIDGVNPFATLVGYTRQTSQNFPKLPPTHPRRLSANALQTINDTRNLLSQVPGVRIVNLSQGFGFGWAGAAPTADELARMSRIANRYGRMFAKVAAAVESSVLFVCSAGNDGLNVPASLNSPMTAARQLGAQNIVVVESHGLAGTRSGFSSVGGDVMAPGEQMLSTAATVPYIHLCGTSAAAPFVSGLAGYLLALDPLLEPAQLIGLLNQQVPRQKVDAFASALELDPLRGNTDVLKMLLDVDDGTPDGSLRIVVPDRVLDRDRAFEPVEAGMVYTNDARGDGQINLADFRRWRDWLLSAEGWLGLNGSDATHPKHDANGDGRVQAQNEIFPRGDFNGDGVMDRAGTNVMPGTLKGQGALPDLEVLIRSGLWADTEIPDPTQLRQLIDSVDLTVSAGNFFAKYPDITQGQVAVYDALTRTPVPFGGPATLTPAQPVRLFTVPAGATYYVASESIPLGGGTNVLMRSVGTNQIPDHQRGADFAVDLTLMEMTAQANVVELGLEEMVSEPNAPEVDAFIQASSGFTTNVAGAQGWANDQATLYAFARTGTIPDVPPNPDTNRTTFNAEVAWQRSFVKHTNAGPTFNVKPMVLRLFDGNLSTDELTAFAEISIATRHNSVDPAAWSNVFYLRAEIAGHAGNQSRPHTFRIVEFIGSNYLGELPQQELTVSGNVTAEYIQPEFDGEIPVGHVPLGSSFELRYTLRATAAFLGGETYAEAFIGDPLDYGTGLKMEYGDFGDLLRLTGYTVDAQGRGHVSFRAHNGFYYILCLVSNNTSVPIAMQLGTDGPFELIDPNPPPGSDLNSYEVKKLPLTQPGDADGDGIHDVYELQHPAILDPLDAADAAADPDGDGYSNLVEFLNGTDPEVADPTVAPVRFPGIVVPSYPGGELIDLNNDGVLDSVQTPVFAALGNPGGTFQTPVQSPVPGSRSIIDALFLRLDGDAFPDVVAADQLTNRLFVLRGVGDGTFVPLANYPTLGDGRQLARGDLNGDGLPDVALMSRNGRGADLFLSAGDGTLTRLAPLTTNAFGTARGLALGDFNGDQRADVVVTYFDEAAVFLSQTNGTYGPAQVYPIGISAESVAVGDLNQDGRPDLVTANRSSDDVSVLLGLAGGAFLPEARYPVGDLPAAVRLADLNGDALPDVIVSRSSADYATVFLTSPGGLLSAPYTVPAGTSLTDIVDWNNDGALDLAGSATGVGGLVLPGNGDGTFQTRLQIVPTNTPPTQVAPVDLNGDNRLELVGLQTQAHAIDVWEHAAVNGTNRLLSSFAVGRYVTAFTHGDFNGDALVDLAVTTETNAFGTPGSNQVVVLTNGGNFTFQIAQQLPLEFQPDRIVAGDLDGDGHRDLAVVSAGGTLNGGSQLVALRGNGSGGFVASTPVEVADVVSLAEAADVDRDGRSELVLRSSRLVDGDFETFLEVFAADAAGGWTNRQSLGFSNVLGSVQLQEMNGDTFPDLVTTEIGLFSGAASYGFYPGGVGGFGARQVLAAEAPFQYFSRIADLNNDGHPDTVAFDSLFLAQPTGGFYQPQPFWIGAAGAERAADFNRDGKLDLMSGLSILLQE